MTRCHWILSLIVVSIGLSGCGGGVATIAAVKFRPSKAATETAAGAESATGDAATGASTAANAGAPGSLRGRVKLEGGGEASRVPLFAAGAVQKDAAVCGVKDIPDESLVGKDGGIGNVFIYLEKTPAGTPALTDAAAEMIFDQKNCVFLPHALFVRKGQKVKILNSDAVLHNTHTFPVKNTALNQGIGQGDKIDWNYTQAERTPFAVTCDIHPWMKAYHLVLDHPYAAISAEDGRFEIPELPAGNHTFRVWHETALDLNKAYKVTVQAGEPTEVELSFPAARFAK